MNSIELLSASGIGALTRPSISIGLLIFTALLHLYLLVKTLRWHHFVSFLISLTGLGLPFVLILEAVIRAAGGPEGELLRLPVLEHYFSTAILMLAPVFLYMKSADWFQLGDSNQQGDLRLLKPLMTWIITLSGLGGLALLIGSALLPGHIMSAASAGEPGTIYSLREYLILGLAVGGLIFTLLLSMRFDVRNLLFFVAVPLGIFATLHSMEILDRSGASRGYSSLGMVIFIASVSFAQLREHLDSAHRTRNIEHELAYLESHDSMTGLENRRRFYARLDALVRGGAAYEDRNDIPMQAVFYIDIDFFNGVNDSLGNEAGNEILKEIARRFQQVVENHGALYRTGGDEFAVLVRHGESELDLAMLSERLLQSFEKPFQVFGQQSFLTASIGISVFPRDGMNIEEITSHADQALQEAKVDRNTYRFYTPSMQERAVSKIQLINYLRQAVDRRELSLHYQPQLDLQGCLVGAEALLRWNHPLLGNISPKDFIPVAEETGLIIPIGTWVIHKACETLSQWRDGGIDLPLSINLSPRQLKDVKLQRTLINALREYNLPPGLLHLEITENSLIENKENLIGRLQSLSDIGLNFSIDDFGTGYSSLSYLKLLPIRAVKIDRSFVLDLPFDSQNSALVQAIITMVQGLGYKVVAEGVDSREQLDFLHKHGCDIIQGYYHSEPLNNERFLNYAASSKLA